LPTAGCKARDCFANRSEAPPTAARSGCRVRDWLLRDQGDTELTEASPPGQGSLSMFAAIGRRHAPAVAAGIRVVSLRFGVILTPKEGAAKMLTPFRLAWGPIATGSSDELDRA